MWNQFIVFFLTLAETLVITWENRADRQSTYSPRWHLSAKSSLWAMVFEAILIADVILVAGAGWELLPAVVVGAGLGKFYALEKRRRKWKNQQFKKVEKKEENEDEDDE